MVIESNHHSSDNLETVCLLGEQKAVADLSAELNEIKGTPEADRKGAAEDHSDQRLALIQKLIEQIQKFWSRHHASKSILH